MCEPMISRLLRPAGGCQRPRRLPAASTLTFISNGFHAPRATTRALHARVVSRICASCRQLPRSCQRYGGIRRWRAERAVALRGRSSAHLLSAAYLANEFTCPETGLTAQPCFQHASAQLSAQVRRNLMPEMEIARRNRPLRLRIEDRKVRIGPPAQLLLCVRSFRRVLPAPQPSIHQSVPA